MTATVVNGTALAERLRHETVERLEELGRRSVIVRLDTVLVGRPHAGLVYAQAQERRCRRLGIDFRLHALPADSTDEQLRTFLTSLSRDPDVTGILLNLPLPPHLDAPAAQYAIDPYKDVEGVNPANIGLAFYGTPIIAPCTARAVMAVLREANVELRGRRVVVVGQGNVAGKPIALQLMCEEATVITCNKYTENLGELTRSAEVLVCAAGVPELIRGEHVQPGAVVIDVGINQIPADPARGVQEHIVGDVCFEDVKALATVITPVPGGIGPVTVAMLLRSAVDAAAKQLSVRRIP